MDELYFLEETEIQMQKMVRTAQFYEDMEILTLKEAENRAFMEDGGSFETLCIFYEEAAEGMEKKKNIFKRAWEAILNLCRKIKEFFTKKKNKKVDPKRTVIVDKNNREIRKKLIAFFSKWKNALSHPVSNPKAFAKAIGPLAALMVSIVTLKAIKGKKGPKKQKENQKQDKKGNTNQKQSEAEPDPSKVKLPVKELQDDAEKLQKDVIETAADAAKEMANASGAPEGVSSQARTEISNAVSIAKKQIEDIYEEIEKIENEIEEVNKLRAEASVKYRRATQDAQNEGVANYENLKNHDNDTAVMRQLKKYEKARDAELQKIEQIKNRNKELDRRASDLSYEIATMKKETKKSGGNSGDKFTIDKLKQELEKTREEWRATERSIDEHYSEFERLNYVTKGLEKNLANPETKKKLREANREFKNLGTRRDYLEKRKRKLEGKIKHLENSIYH